MDSKFKYQRSFLYLMRKMVVSELIKSLPGM